ncbi:tail fiber [Salmonella phage 38]|uniref:Tail fiber n=1 Tax=Salmonella phage 38 TaxID=1654891 RepID=A0A0N7CEJ2_9CAUD|nr:tail fiber [Salmonella phage 38]AKJ73858.1 tail fiber [Salmonella phage 38]
MSGGNHANNHSISRTGSVRNKPETERNHVVTGVAKGWQKTSLNQDPDEILTECKGLDALLTKSNLQADGVTKVDPTKPIGFQVSYESTIRMPF